MTPLPKHMQNKSLKKMSQTAHYNWSYNIDYIMYVGIINGVYIQ